MNFRHKILFTISFCSLLLSCKTPALHQKGESKKVLFGLVDDLDSLDLKTGDLAMFQSLTTNGILTQIGTIAPYTHCAIVIKNEDGQLLLLHTTDNDFAGERMPVLGETEARNGVILTKFQNSFISTNSGKSGFYRRVWILPFDDSWATRPTNKDLFEMYEKNKKYPFTKSKVPFIFSAFDLSLFGHDFLSIPDDHTMFCSEFVHQILKELKIPVTDDQKGNEYTPKDIRNLEPYQTATPIIFKFKNGRYRFKNEIED
jgi:hypothetical protein